VGSLSEGRWARPETGESPEGGVILVAFSDAVSHKSRELLATSCQR
jgi:hypothetical protein